MLFMSKSNRLNNCHSCESGNPLLREKTGFATRVLPLVARLASLGYARDDVALGNDKLIIC